MSLEMGTVANHSGRAAQLLDSAVMAGDGLRMRKQTNQESISKGDRTRRVHLLVACPWLVYYTSRERRRRLDAQAKDN